MNALSECERIHSGSCSPSVVKAGKIRMLWPGEMKTAQVELERRILTVSISPGVVRAQHGTPSACVDRLVRYLLV